MAESARNKKLVYHLTHLTNVPGAVATGLRSRRDLRAGSVSFADHADPDILASRSEHDLERFVPFHFIPKSPFDYGVIRAAPQDSFVLIAVSRRFAAASGWAISPRHPLTAREPPRVLNWLEGLDAIDWNQMDKPTRDYDLDRECRLVCMAEALSPTSVPAAAWHSIYVATNETQQAVRSILMQAKISKYVDVAPGMFPKGAR